VNVNNAVLDTLKPVVTVSAPTDGAVLSGTVNVTISGSDNVGVTRVEWFLDEMRENSNSGAVGSFNWNTTGAANGSHELIAFAFDAAGNFGTSTLTVTVNNVVLDTAAPVATISSPASGATVSGVVNVAFSGSDNVGVSSVELYIDGSLATTVSAASGSFTWDTSIVANGSHTLQARAYDAAGNVGASAILSVTVNNVAPDTTAPSVQITSPTSGTKISKNVKVTVAANDNVGVASIELYIDGKLYQSVAGSSAIFNWNTAKVSAGSHTLQAFASDVAGNKGASTTVTVSK
jgi:chitinase